jgi:hypothetical protein
MVTYRIWGKTYRKLWICSIYRTKYHKQHILNVTKNVSEFTASFQGPNDRSNGGLAQTLKFKDLNEQPYLSQEARKPAWMHAFILCVHLCVRITTLCHVNM